MGRIWAQITSALRSQTGEMAEATVVSRALRILEQQIRDAGESLDDTRCDLARLVASSMLATQDLDRVDKRLETLTHDAPMTLATGREDLARTIAEQISRLERARAQGARLVNEYRENVQALRSVLRNSEEKLRDLKVQVEVIRTRERASHGQAALYASRPDATEQLRRAGESLDVIRQQQLEAAALLQARQEVLSADAGLSQRLREAGVSLDLFDADSLPDRIKANTSRSA